MRLVCIGNFSEYIGGIFIGDKYEPIPTAGLRNSPFFITLIDYLSKYYEVIRVDTSKTSIHTWENTWGISTLFKDLNFKIEDDDIIFYIQNHLNFSKDISNPIIYFHIDGPPAFNISDVGLGFRRYSRDYYPVGLKHITLQHWIFPELHNPNKEKTNFIIDLSRDTTIEKYKGILESSKYILIKGDWVSNRVFEAMVSKTIPLIITWKENRNFIKMRQVYEEMGLKDGVNCYFIDLYDWNRTLVFNEYNEVMAQEGFELIIKNHTFHNRIEKIKQEIDNYMNSISKT